MTNSEALQGSIVSIKLKEEDPLTIGYIVKRNHMLSEFARMYLKELKKYKQKM